MKKLGAYLAGILLALAVWTCSLPHEPGPQPSTIVETEFDSALNVFGVLRLDGEAKSSFFYIERTYQYEELDTISWDESFIPVVTDATVLIRGMGDTTTYEFTHELDSLRGEIYTCNDYIPLAGETYTLTITHPGFPTITDTTMVPAIPALYADSVIVWGDMVYFQQRTAADVYLYDIIMLSSEDSLQYRFQNRDGSTIPIAFQSTAPPEESVDIQVYGYDANLAEYLTTTITLKPQTYNETVTTVTGGYGVFGSVSVAAVTVPGAP
ncbi:DUF4249 family protein [Candidatus Neomarinimicrobiota bacterium]